MYQIATNATATPARIRMSVLCPESVAGALIEGRLVAGVDAFSDMASPAFKSSTLGLRAWSPPV